MRRDRILKNKNCQNENESHERTINELRGYSVKTNLSSRASCKLQNKQSGGQTYFLFCFFNFIRLCNYDKVKTFE
jgi:hypothetical protein